MAYTLFDAAQFADARPIDAATLRDVVREDLSVLKVQSPTIATWPFTNGIPQSVEGTYTDASVMYRSPRKRLRPAHPPMVMRRLTFTLFCRVSNAAATGTYRVWAARRFAVPANVAEADFITGTTTTTSTAGEWKEITIYVHRDKTLISADGFAVTEVAAPYRCTFVGVQAKVTVGHTVYLDEMGCEEVSP